MRSALTATSPQFISDWTIGCILLICHLHDTLLFLSAWSPVVIIYVVYMSDTYIYTEWHVLILEFLSRAKN